MAKIGRRVLVLASLAGTVILLAASNPMPARPKQDSTALSLGLRVWRKAGAIQGGAACATCHSPDGIELAVYNFDDADLTRRALPHLGVADSKLLVDYIRALRDKLHLTTLRDPIRDRPLQPGGSVLPGETSAARDFAFGQEIKQQIPLLFGPRIETIEQAKAAEDELLKIDPKRLKIGFPLNRLSEDIVHGTDHASIAQWLPELPPTIPESSLNDWYAAEDAYLANPTIEQLRRLLEKQAQLVNPSRMLGFGSLSVAKFRALLVWQDRVRNHTEEDPSPISAEVRPVGGYNPIWDVGEVSRDIMGRKAGELGMDEAMRTSKLAESTITSQERQLRLSWFWAGWLSDQGMFKTSHDDKTRLGMWMSQSLSQDGPYPIHNVFSNARRQAVVSNDLDSWGEPLIRRRRIWDMAGLRSFAYYQKDLPEDPEYRKMTVEFTANCFRMNLLLLKDEILRTHSVWVKQSAKSNVLELVKFLKSNEPDGGASAEQLSQDLMKLIDAAKERNQFSPSVAAP